MPAFIENGPDIPDELLEAHEQGRVVFFCGAGVSYPAGLPSFENLARGIFHELGTTPSVAQNAALNSMRFDMALDLLEREKPEGHIKVRRALVKLLTPNLQLPGALDTHRALLALGTTRQKKARVVTTNFDRLFEIVIAESKLDIETCKAPLLPVPKNRLDSVVYLHGLIEDSPKEEMLHRLVVTSGDFGRAYLNERWAAVFVSELFRNFKVCFVGYSLEDPVMRYMMDALAGDKLLGESTIEMYAFAAYEIGQHKQAERDWRSKNVTPILYSDANEHALLHNTLHEWARTYRDGLRGKEMVLQQHCGTKPASNSRFDYAVGRVMWALTNAESDNELAAKYFADMEPVPPLEWLGPLEEGQFRHNDLTRFGIAPEPRKNDELKFSFLRRPTPYSRAQWMTLVGMGPHGGDLDGVMRYIAKWLTRHLGNERLLFWLAKWGGRLHWIFAAFIREQLRKIDNLEKAGNTEQLEKMRKHSPDSIPSAPVRILLDLFLEGRIRGPNHGNDLYSWYHKFKAEGVTPALLPELRELLTPCVHIRERIPWPIEGEEEDGTSSKPKTPTRVKDIVDLDIMLASNHVHVALRDIFRTNEWKDLMAQFLPTASLMLRDAMDLHRMLGIAGDRSDASYVYQPSISPHHQNRDFRDWTALIDMCRDGWLAVAKHDPESALAWATLWFKTPYPLFKRLAFFAAAQPNSPVSKETAFTWLTSDDTYWFWSAETQREAMRLIVALAPKFDAKERARFEQIALLGPPRSMYKANITEERWLQAWADQVWHALAKFRSVAKLGAAAQEKLDAIEKSRPDLKLEPEDRDEFSIWSQSGYRVSERIATPRDCKSLRQWLKDHPDVDFREDDDWAERCNSEVPVTIWVLQDLAKEGIYPISRWREAIHVWDQDKMLARMWRLMSKHVLALPDPQFNELAHSLGQWIKDEAKVFVGKDERFFDLCSRLLAYDDGKESAKKDVITDALNHPIGYGTQALLAWWFRQALKDKMGLDPRLKPIFTKLADTTVHRFRAARIFFAQNAVSLFRVDEQWTRNHVVPLFDWNKSYEDAQRAWSGFLWSPQLYRPFIAAIKPYLLDTAKHYDDLSGDHDGDQYAQVLAYLALDPADVFTKKELAETTRALPQDGLERGLLSAVNGLQNAGDQREEYWRNRVKPYVQGVWPDQAEKTSEVAMRMAQLCVAAGEAFPDAVEELKGWLTPIDHANLLFGQLLKGQYAHRHPDQALEFMDRLTANKMTWLPGEFSECLGAIAAAKPALKDNFNFKRLSQLFSSRGT